MGQLWSSEDCNLRRYEPRSFYYYHHFYLVLRKILITTQLTEVCSDILLLNFNIYLLKKINGLLQAKFTYYNSTRRPIIYFLH